MKRQNKSKLLGIVAVLFLLQGFLHVGAIYPNWKKNYGTGGVAGGSPDQMLLQLFGFREFLAGMLWVRADGFFDEGNYDAVLPLIRLCTILDPKQIDIYSTGMWHIAYNFTDEEQRSDRRYIASALALGKEGAQKNDYTYELFFETGWIWYHKIDDDYYQSVKWFQEAQMHDDMQQGRKNILANAFERNNQIEEALAHYYKVYDQAMTAYKETQDYQNFQLKETVESNIDTMIVRMIQRGYLANERGDYDKADYDTKPPWDVKFSVRVTVEDQRVLRVQGTWNVKPVGTRVRMVLRDEIFDHATPAGMDWDFRKPGDVDLDLSRTSTFMEDSLFVKNSRFTRRVDMSKDPTMYPFSIKSPTYLVEFYYNPRSAPPHIQDKFGFNGEGMTDKTYLNTEIRQNKMWVPIWKDGKEPAPGTADKYKYLQGWTLKDLGGKQPVIYVVLKLTRDQILRQGEWSDKIPIVQTPNFNPASVTSTDNDVIAVPSLRQQTEVGKG